MPNSDLETGYSKRSRASARVVQMPKEKTNKP